MSEEATKAEVVYLGRRTLSTGKLGEAWISLKALDAMPAVPPEMADRNASLFAFKGKGRRIVGGVYDGTVKFDEAGGLKSLAVGGYQRRVADQTQVIAWSASDVAADTRKRQVDLEKRLADDTGLERELVNLRRAFQRTPFGDRAAFEMMVLRRLRSPK